jgi:hypothetical protein
VPYRFLVPELTLVLDEAWFILNGRVDNRNNNCVFLTPLADHEFSLTSALKSSKRAREQEFLFPPGKTKKPPTTFRKFWLRSKRINRRIIKLRLHRSEQLYTHTKHFSVAGCREVSDGR